MIGPRSQFLLSIASDALSDSNDEVIDQGRIGAELSEVLKVRNGFYGFESSLYVRGFGDAAGDLLGWNSDRSWRKGYGSAAVGLFFFAEDVFGFQFAIERETIVRFDVETGRRTRMASSFEDFADQLLDDYNYLTGYPLAKAWQDRHGALVPGQRLMPLTPFVLGGEFSVSNLTIIDDIRGMTLRAELATQIGGAADGTKIVIRPN